ncbi:MAG: peptide ABC transporter substrate-binding protein [Candidatus Rokuibacteriota bacterium]|nr:MAG: peptide ABC transporter substrate-binding protein [Candidatus Rokubacteria bacterium]
MNGRKSWWILGTLAIVLLSVVSVAPDAAAQKKGGVLKVGNLGEPPTLDAHWTTATITEVITNHIYEGLYSIDAKAQPIPMLAEGMPTVSKDSLTYTFKLRSGIKFHNGKEMTSADVVASLNRWGAQSTYGKNLYARVAEVRAVDKLTVDMQLKEKTATVVIALAIPNNFAAIYPKEIIDKFKPAEKATEWIGTGPFKLVEWKPDRHIKMARFDDYKPRSEPASGYGGKKVAYVDELLWIPVPDAATRVAQIETGEVDFADDLDLNAYERLKKVAGVQPIVAKPYYWLVAVFNKKEGLMTNQKLRQAWQATLDIEPIMKTVAGGHAELYRMDSSLAFAENSLWHTKLQGLPWNEHNRDKAKRLLREAGYRGEPIRFMTTQEYKWMYDFALLSKQQLEDVGFTIDLQVVDWATLVKRRNNPKEYDAFTTGIGAFYDPTQHVYLGPNWPGWTDEPEINRLLGEMAGESDYKKRYALWEQTTRLFYEKVPVARYGDLFGLRAMRKHVKGFDTKPERPRFYNVWLEK